QAAITNAKATLEQSRSVLQSAERSAQEHKAEHEAAKSKLGAAKENAVLEFERARPEPRIAAGVKPEADYLMFFRIKELSDRGWGFGHGLDAGGKPPGAPGNHVKGLVASVGAAGGPNPTVSAKSSANSAPSSDSRKQVNA